MVDRSVHGDGLLARLRSLTSSATGWAAVALVAIFVVGGALRLHGLDWDDGHHLHPDERYLAIVANDIRGPDSFAGYFDVEASPLSPYNIDSGRAYVYGELPLYATKLAAGLLGRDSYGELYLVGRHMSAIVDVLSVLVVFLIGRLLFASRGPRTALLGALLASALYAVSVTAIQHAHYFTVESWLVLLTLVTFWFAALAATRTDLADAPRYAMSLAVGAALGGAMSCKLSGALVLLPVGIAFTARALAGPRSPPARVVRAAADALTVAVSAYVAFRLTSPYAFERSSWLDVTANHDFRRALEGQQEALNGSFLYPPAYQWLLSDRIVDPARNLLGWGLGPPLGVAAVAGLVLLAVALVGRAGRRVRVGELATDAPWVIGLMLVAFVVVTFGYFGTRFAHSMRYLVPIVPFLCLAAAYSVLSLRRLGLVRPLVGGALVAVTLLWALAFTHVYRQPNTRVVATTWLNASAEPGSTIVAEHWDDALPVGAVPGRYRTRELPVFDPDDTTKLEKLYNGLHDAEYYVLSSPRAWNTIGRLPDRFPIMVRFYERLRDGSLGFERVASFTSLPRLVGVSIDDLDAEETFWVYDHPPVAVYRRVLGLTLDQFRKRICAGEALSGCP